MDDIKTTGVVLAGAVLTTTVELDSAGSKEGQGRLYAQRLDCWGQLDPSECQSRHEMHIPCLAATWPNAILSTERYLIKQLILFIKVCFINFPCHDHQVIVIH